MWPASVVVEITKIVVEIVVLKHFLKPCMVAFVHIFLVLFSLFRLGAEIGGFEFVAIIIF